MNRPRILISGTAGRMEHYIAAVARAGGLPQAAYCPATGAGCAGLILGGGGDMAPDLFGRPDEGSREIDRVRDLAEMALVKEFMARGAPILGICRGHQLFNLLLGGSLMQDLPAALLPFHDPQAADAAGDLRHSIACAEGSFLARVYGRLTLCNSSHHQALTAVGRGMRVTAWTESGLIEASEHESLPILTLQFHPERMEEGGPVFDWLLAACRAPS